MLLENWNLKEIFKNMYMYDFLDVFKIHVQYTYVHLKNHLKLLVTKDLQLVSHNFMYNFKYFGTLKNNTGEKLKSTKYKAVPYKMEPYIHEWNERIVLIQ